MRDSVEVSVNTYLKEKPILLGLTLSSTMKKKLYFSTWQNIKTFYKYLKHIFHLQYLEASTKKSLRDSS